MARWIGTFLIVLSAGFIFNVVEAGDTPKTGKLDVDVIFKKLDTDNDGVLSKDEFLKLAERFKDKQKARDRLTIAYEKIDTTKMGLSMDQFRSYLEAVRKKKNPN